VTGGEPRAIVARDPWSRGERVFLAVALVVALAMRVSHWQGEDPYFMGPLYPHFLAAVYTAFGRSLDAVRVIQIGASVATVGLMHVLGRQYGGRRLAMICSGTAALYGPFVYYSVSLLYPTITVLLACILLTALHEASRRRSLLWALAAGLALGAYALGRGNILLFAPAAFFWLVAAWGRPFAPAFTGWKAGLPAGLVLAGGTLLAIAPATLHNLRTGDPTLLTTNAGLNLYIGNGPMATGGHQTPELHLRRPDGTVEIVTADLHKDVECRTEAEYALGRPLTYTEVSSFWFDETLRRIGEDPGRFVSLLAMKTVHFWSTYEIPQIEHFGYFRRFSAPLRGPVLGFGLIGPLALVGLALATRRPARWWLPGLFVAFYSASIVLFFVLARYRLPIVPVLALFAGHASLEAVLAVRARRWPRAAWIVAAAVALGLLMRANLYGVDESKGIAQILYRHGIVADAERDWEGAIDWYEQALQLKPDYDKCHLNLGVALARVGRFEPAEEHVRRAAELNPGYYRAPYNLGLVMEQRGRVDEADAAYARAVELEPRYLLARTALAESRLRAGDRAGAREQVEAVLAYDGAWEGPGNAGARVSAARLEAYLDERDALDAVGRGECFAESGDFRRAEVARLRNDVEGVLAALRRYFEGGGTCAEAYRSLGRVLLVTDAHPGATDAFQRGLAADPGLPGLRLGLGLLAAIDGRADEAIRWLEEETALDPAAPEPCLELGLVHERLREDGAAAETWYERYRQRGGDPELLRGRRSFVPRTDGGAR